LKWNEHKRQAPAPAKNGICWYINVEKLRQLLHIAWHLKIAVKKQKRERDCQSVQAPAAKENLFETDK